MTILLGDEQYCLIDQLQPFMTAVAVALVRVHFLLWSTHKK